MTAATPPPSRSRKVRRILTLEARARRLLARHERALARATRAKRDAGALLDEVRALEARLTGSQLGDLRRARTAAAAESATAANGTGARRA